MNFNLDTEQGMANAVLWTQALFERINNGGTWVVPRSGTIITVHHTNKTATIKSGHKPDPSLKRVIKAMGWDVKEQ